MGGGRRYDKQGSAYAIRINREAIHRKDRGRGSARKGQGREGGEEGRGGKGKGGGREEGAVGRREGGQWKMWLELHAQFTSCTMEHIKYIPEYRVANNMSTMITYIQTLT